MKLIKIREALFDDAGVLMYHINFDAMLTAKDGRKGTRRRKTTCQAVVIQHRAGPVEVYVVNENEPEKWCKERQPCSCGVLTRPTKPKSRKDMLNSDFPEFSKWYSSSDDEVEDHKNMKPDSRKQSPSASSIGEVVTDLEN